MWRVLGLREVRRSLGDSLGESDVVFPLSHHPDELAVMTEGRIRAVVPELIQVHAKGPDLARKHVRHTWPEYDCLPEYRSP